jgi:hypothetical protein
MYWTVSTVGCQLLPMATQSDDTVEPLIRDFIDWLDREPRTYAEANATWRTSCPRLPVWEEAFDRGLVSRTHKSGRPHIVLTPAGRAMLSAAHMPSPRRVLWPIRILEAYFEALRSLRRFEIAIRTGRLDRTPPEKLWPRWAGGSGEKVSLPKKQLP